MLPVGLYKWKKPNVHSILTIVFKNILRCPPNSFKRTFSLSPKIRRSYKKECMLTKRNGKHLKCQQVVLNFVKKHVYLGIAFEGGPIYGGLFCDSHVSKTDLS